MVLPVFLGLSINKLMHITNGNRKRRRSNKGMKLSSWNCGGGFITKGKKMEIEKYMKEQNVDILAVSEVEITKTSFHYDQLYHIDGYKVIFPMSWTTKGKARLICYYKESLGPLINQGQI